MAKIFDRCKFNVSGTPGTGDITVGTRASTSFFLPSEAGAVSGDKTYYLALDGTDEEHGICTLGASAGIFTRDVVLHSIISGTAGTTKLTLTSSAVISFGAPSELFRSL